MPETSPCEDGPLTSLLNSAVGGDHVAKKQAFDCLWPEIEKLDHRWSRLFNTRAGSRTSEPVTYQRGRDVFDSTLKWSAEKGFAWNHPGAFLKKINDMLRWRNLDALKELEKLRRERINELLKSTGVPSLGDLSDSERREWAERIAKQIDEPLKSTCESGFGDLVVSGEPSPVEDAIQNEHIKRENAKTDEQHVIDKELEDHNKLRDAIYRMESIQECISTELTEPIEQFIFVAMALQGLNSREVRDLLQELFEHEKSVDEIETMLPRLSERIKKCLRTRTNGAFGW